MKYSLVHAHQLILHAKCMHACLTYMEADTEEGRDSDALATMGEGAGGGGL